jgi:hypothetical protein
VTFSQSYLHQDWDLDFESPEDALLVFANNHPDAAVSVAEACAALLHEWSSEARRYEVLATIGWNFSGPSGRLDSFLEWASSAMAQLPAENSTG